MKIPEKMKEQANESLFIRQHPLERQAHRITFKHNNNSQ